MEEKNIKLQLTPPQLPFLTFPISVFSKSIIFRKVENCNLVFNIQTPQSRSLPANQGGDKHGGVLGTPLDTF